MKAGKPRDAKHAVTAGLNNEIVETLRSNLRRQDKFHSPIASVSSGYTYGERSVKASEQRYVEITLQRSAVGCENHRFATWIKFNLRDEYSVSNFFCSGGELTNIARAHTGPSSQGL